MKTFILEVEVNTNTKQEAVDFIFYADRKDIADGLIEVKRWVTYIT